MVTAEIVIDDLRTPSDSHAFKLLNEAYLRDIGQLSTADSVNLDCPLAAIVEPGGCVLLARHSGRVVGTVALLPCANDALELARMTVAKEMRGRGVGHSLLQAALARATELQAETIFLVTRKELTTAIRLYEEAGFLHVSPDSLPRSEPRAEVWMSRPIPRPV